MRRRLTGLSRYIYSANNVFASVRLTLHRSHGLFSVHTAYPVSGTIQGEAPQTLLPESPRRVAGRWRRHSQVVCKKSHRAEENTTVVLEDHGGNSKVYAQKHQLALARGKLPRRRLLMLGAFTVATSLAPLPARRKA